ncbi:class I SAM-dependent methyltransferase [Altericroceibacterium spongiae]|uniref:Class I SAM-dependent methyltransferase n=1 Tax=Altericroceibacterium spongiae TaxID=2320269 RepID=A0A420EAE1_9SPHN|nr:class I SAM-dependent methyltransferase [Altericroceibacterium spongiae]RKF17635.1 class I SAM-dependent methyltransferase [Altericroceibacterium spongiae]
MSGKSSGSAGLSGVPETLLITLAARVVASSQNADLGFVDPAAERIAASLKFDPGRFSDDHASMRGTIVRAQWFDGIARRFIEAQPDGLVISIGSGLDTRANRIAPPAGVDWIDIDFPEVTELRDRLVPPLGRTRNLAADGTAVATWAQTVPWDAGRATLVMAEGVSMYLEPREAATWLRGLTDAASARQSRMTLALDLASPLMVRQSHRHPSVSKTKARFQWGVRRPEEVNSLAEGLVLSESYDVAAHSGTASRIAAAIYRAVTRGRPIYCCARFEYGTG